MVSVEFHQQRPFFSDVDTEVVEAARPLNTQGESNEPESIVGECRVH